MKPLLILAALTVQSLAQNPRALMLDASKFPSLQAAIDALPEAGGQVTIPPGLYEITEPLRVRTGDTRIVGAGAATHIHNKNDQGAPSFILRPPRLDEDKTARLWRVQLSDLRISGSEKSGDGLYAEGMQEIYLEGLSIDHHGGHGVNLKSCFEDPRIADCIVTYNKKSGIEISDCHDIVVNANHFEENLDALHCADSFNLCMNGNNIDDHLRHGIVIENTYGSVVSGNMVEECNGTALILDRDCYGITLSSNVIAHHLEGGVDLRDACGCTLSANTFTIAHRFSIRVSAGSERNTISGNTFCNTYIGANQNKRPTEAKTPMGIDEGTGILLESGVNGLTINGNTFSGLSTEAVWTEGELKNLIVTSNLCIDCGRKIAKGSTWLRLPKEANVLVKDNLTPTP
jgi:parallel beta-helix repeat protein